MLRTDCTAVLYVGISALAQSQGVPRSSARLGVSLDGHLLNMRVKITNWLILRELLFVEFPLNSTDRQSRGILIE